MQNCKQKRPPAASLAILCMATVASALFVVGCDGNAEDRTLNDDPKPSDVDLENTPPRSNLESNPVVSQSDAVGTMDSLFSAMEDIGEGSTERYEREWRAFAARPHALDELVDTFNGSLPEDRVLRWKVAYSAGRIASESSSSFLKQLAVEPPIDAEDSGYHTRATAAIGLAKMAASGKVPQARSAMMAVLSDATAGVAQSAALELFAAGKLEDGHRRVLESRKIPSKFRRLSNEESNELFKIDPAELEDQRSDRKHSAAVPAEHEG